MMHSFVSPQQSLIYASPPSDAQGVQIASYMQRPLSFVSVPVSSGPVWNHAPAHPHMTNFAAPSYTMQPQMPISSASMTNTAGPAQTFIGSFPASCVPRQTFVLPSSFTMPGGQTCLVSTNPGLPKHQQTGAPHSQPFPSLSPLVTLQGIPQQTTHPVPAAVSVSSQTPSPLVHKLVIPKPLACPPPPPPPQPEAAPATAISVDALPTTNQSPKHDEQKHTSTDASTAPSTPSPLSALQSVQRPFRCPLSDCGLSFASQFSLRRHMKKHSGVKPHPCTFPGCGKTFAERSTLKRHIRAHTGEKPYKCTVDGCAKEFADSTNLKRHIMVHEGTRPYMCPLDGCPRGFYRRRQLYNHITERHPEVSYNSLPEPCRLELHRYFSQDHPHLR